MVSNTKSRRGTQPKRNSVARLSDVWAQREIGGRGVYAYTDAYIVDVVDSPWGTFLQKVMLSDSADESKAPVEIWEVSPVAEGLSTGSDIGEPPVWYQWKLRWVKFPEMHLEGHRV